MKPENVTCPKCRGPMVSRKTKQGGRRFWGCARFPECDGTRDSDGMSFEERRAERRNSRERDDEDEATD